MRGRDHGGSAGRAGSIVSSASTVVSHRTSASSSADIGSDGIHSEAEDETLAVSLSGRREELA